MAHKCLDADDQLRLSDQQENLQRYGHITGMDSEAITALMDRTQGLLQGRVGWRFRTDDRLPIIGAVPSNWNHQALRLREITRQRGLYVCSALGSRGITWAPLAGQILAAHLAGMPMPLEGELVDALDPARFMVRGNRKAVAGG
jgi:tRNA 5-methylaminomethyl-2-thiouridine biosynthesis bifunctional protein